MEIKRYDPLIDLLFRGLSIYRWNNFPRIESVTVLDHSGFALHIAILLSYLIEERTGKIYDREAIMHRILFGVFFATTHSDINHDVKESMKRLSPETYQVLSENTYKSILEYPMHDIFRADLYKSMISRDNSEIDAIVRYAKLYANLIEARTNARVYPEVYTRVIESIWGRMNGEEFLPFREILPIDGESEIHLFLMTIRRLQSTYRWNMDRRTYPVSVMSHLIFVLFFTYILSLKYPESIGDRTDAMITSIYHDVPEGITGDIITPTKEALPEIRPLLEAIEADKIDSELLTYIRFTTTHHTLRERILTPWKMPGGSVIKLADHYSALYEAKVEIPTHTEMQEVYDRIEEIIHLKQKVL